MYVSYETDLYVEVGYERLADALSMLTFAASHARLPANVDV